MAQQGKAASVDEQAARLRHLATQKRRRRSPAIIARGARGGVNRAMMFAIAREKNRNPPS
jgi:hypothetical protein